MIDEVNIIRAENEIDAVSALAEEIWIEHFVPIIGVDQVNFMLKKFQSIEAISEQMLKGYEYYVAKFKEELIGYFALVPDHPNGRLMISKFYVKHAARGKGLGKTMLQFIEHRALTMSISRLRLTVNRFNQSSISWYLRRGFKTVEEVDVEIGGGFYMNDFIMEKTIVL
ncbi:MAG: GNAT family N-acetyltransferase [Gammaproteobacteria bacterium]|nr:GNAT family N-acetyltransferase [Gammaproteobacteria bacterium]